MPDYTVFNASKTWQIFASKITEDNDPTANLILESGGNIQLNPADGSNVIIDGSMNINKNEIFTSASKIEFKTAVVPGTGNAAEYRFMSPDGTKAVNFYVRNNGTTQIYFPGETQFINNAGNFYVCTSNPYFFYNRFTQLGQTYDLKVAATSGANPDEFTDFWMTSDDRLKHNEVNINNGLDIIRLLEPQRYQKTKEMKAADYMGDISGDWVWEAGIIAQDVLQIPDLSHCVYGGDYIDNSGNLIENQYLLKYTDLFVYNLAATKELDTKNTALEAELAATKAELATVKTALNNLLLVQGLATI